MSEEVKLNRPAMQSNVRLDMVSESRSPRSSKLPWVILAVVVVVIVAVVILFRDKWGGGAAAVKSSDYQAVFLTNGQVYFGKLSDTHDQYATLTDIYYLQVNQPQIQGSQQTQQQAQAQPQLQLVKLGNELHGPMDEMKINREHILFHESLKPEGKVVQAIKEHKTNPQGGANQPTGQTVPTPAQQQSTPPPAQQLPTATPTPGSQVEQR